MAAADSQRFPACASFGAVAADGGCAVQPAATGEGFRLETLEGLCRALDCRIEDLIEYVPETDPELPRRTEGTVAGDPDSGRADVVAAGPTPEDAQPVPPSQ